MSIQVCLFLCVLIICITYIILQIIEKYPQWCTYYEYKQKAKLYDEAKEENNKQIELTKKEIEDWVMKHIDN